MARKADWFTIVATDLFAGAFAAIIIIDAATPKEPLALGQPALIDIRYPAPANIMGLDCSDPTNLVFVFEDDTGETYNSLDFDLAGQRAGEECQIVGVIDDVALTSAPEAARILSAYRPEGEPLGEVTVTLQTFSLTCTEFALCTE